MKGLRYEYNTIWIRIFVAVTSIENDTQHVNKRQNGTTIKLQKKRYQKQQQLNVKYFNIS